MLGSSVVQDSDSGNQPCGACVDRGAVVVQPPVLEDRPRGRKSPAPYTRGAHALQRLLTLETPRMNCSRYEVRTS